MSPLSRAAENIRIALTTDRAFLEAAVREAHDKASALRGELREVELLMARAREILDVTGFWIPWPPLPSPQRPPTLHEAMRIVLVDRRNGWISPRDLAYQIARRGLYRRKDGLPPTPRDVSARINSYPGMFEREGYDVRLRCPPPGCLPRHEQPLRPRPPRRRAGQPEQLSWEFR